MALFQPGQTKIGGRGKGVRNKLSHVFLTDLLEEWTAHGKEALRIARVEDPIRFTIMVAGILPKEFELYATSAVHELSDEDLQNYLDYARRELEQRKALQIEHKEILDEQVH